MKVAFITPTLHTLFPDWVETPLAPAMAGPLISGYLYAHGFRDVRQYEFAGRVFGLEEREPGRLALTRFAEDDAVTAYLSGDDDGGGASIAAEAELILETLAVEAADVFGVSCALSSQDFDETRATINLALCLVKRLKDRFPGCRTVLGGITLVPTERQRKAYFRALERCRELDYAVLGPGEAPMLHILEHLSGKASFAANRQRIEAHGHGTFVDEHREIRATTPSLPDEAPDADGLLTRMWRRARGVASDARGRRADVYVTPYFDPKALAERRRSGPELAARYHLPEADTGALLATDRAPGVVIPLVFMQGCNGRCAFCNDSLSKMVARDPEDAVRTIAWLAERYDTRYFHFINTNINGYREYAERFCDALLAADLGILWSDSVNLRVLDERLLDKLCRSGLRRIATGLEAPSNRLLKYIRKGLTVEKGVEGMRRLHERGVWTHMQLIAGMPTETEDDRREMVDFLQATSAYTNAYTVSPFRIESASAMGQTPAKYGIELLTDRSDGLEYTAFNEVGGLPWEEKRRQIARSTEFLCEAIVEMKGTKYMKPGIDLDLIFWLYDCLGPERKTEVVRIWESSHVTDDLVEGHPAELVPALRDLVLRLKNGARERRFAALRLKKLRLSPPDRLWVDLAGEGEALTVMLIPQKEGDRHYTTKGDLGLSYARETPLDTPTRKAALDALREFV